MKKLKTIYLVLAFSIFCGKFNFVYSQDAANTIGRVNISSPNASSLGKYGDVPVSYHTGIPQINIPVYTITSGKLSLPISLDYHASGLKVQEQASWVGAGWSLNAGGMITRSVRGAADDRGNNNGYVTHGYYSDSGYYNYLMKPDGSVPPAANTNGMGPDDGQFLANKKDGEPDIYTFNVGGTSGKFYFNDDQSAVLVPEGDFKIQTDFSLGAGFLGFIITTPDGTKHYFGKTGNSGAVDPVEITYSITTQNPYGLSARTTSSWFLNKMVSADGMDSILLNYQQENYSHYAISMFPLYYSGLGIFNNSAGNFSYPGSYPYEYDLVKNYIQGVRLSSIVYANGTVSFVPHTSVRTDLAGFTDQTLNDQVNTEAKALKSIEISNNDAFCKKFTLYTSYFYDNVNGLNGGLFQLNYPTLIVNSDKYRLRLDSIQEAVCVGSANISPYKFSYYTELVPRKLSFGIDHWGFYNGVTNNTTLIPSTTMFTNQTFLIDQGANRDAAWPAMRGGSLDKITYPTGGFTQFDFEPNSTYTSFTNHVSTNRISMSIGYDGNSTPVTYVYSFNASPFQAIVSNTNNGIGGSYANLQIKNSSNVIVFNSGQINPGQSQTFNLLFTPGSYTLTLTKQSPTSGFGASVSVNELVPTVQSSNTNVGGLRIKTITSNDGVTTQTITKSYGYNIANSPTGNSSGILYSKPSYIQVVRNGIMGLIWGGSSGGFTNGCASPSGSPTKVYYKSPSSIRPMETTQGNHIGYNEVYVSQTNNGYSVYRYYGSNVWDNVVSDVCKRILTNLPTCDPAIPNHPEAPLPFESMRGELKYEGHFNQAGQVLNDTWYYPEYTQGIKPTPGHIAFQSTNISSFTDYMLYTYKKTKTRAIATKYSVSSGPFSSTNTVYYGSRFHNQPTRKIQTTSTTDSLATNLKYAADFRITSCDNQPDSVTYYLNQIQSITVTFNNTLGTCTPQTGNPDYTNCRYLALIKFRYDLSLARIKYMKYLKRTFSNAGSLLNTCYTNAKNTAGIELKPILELQNDFQNPVIEQSTWRNTNLTNAGFTRYNYATVPVNEVYPNKSQSINLLAPSASFTNANVSGATIVKDSRYADESFYTFKSGNPSDVTPRDGVVQSYIWDYKNTLPVAKMLNAASSNAAYTSFEADGKGGWTYTGSSTPDVSSPMGKKCYTLVNGVNNITRTGLTSSTVYIISYWTKNGSAYNITGTISGYPVQGRSAEGWKYFEHKITAQTSVTIAGNGTIDELRLYPEKAQVISMNYDPLLGMTSQCDANNRITYNKYDGLGRLTLVRDQGKNILKKICYNYSGYPETCIDVPFASIVKSGTFTKNNCTANYTGSQVVYTVLAGAYTSTISQADADQQAQNDVNANGQAYANANGTCTYNGPLVTINGYNAKTSSLQVKFTNAETTYLYSFMVNANTYSPYYLGQIPPGTYTVQFLVGSPVAATYNINGFTQSGMYGATFYNISISSTSTASRY